MAAFELQKALNGVPLITAVGDKATSFKPSYTNASDYKYTAIVSYENHYYNSKGEDQLNEDFNLNIDDRADITTKGEASTAQMTIRDSIALSILQSLITTEQLSSIKELISELKLTINSNITNNSTVNIDAVLSSGEPSSIGESTSNSNTSGGIITSKLEITPDTTIQEKCILAYQYADALLTQSLK